MTKDRLIGAVSVVLGLFIGITGFLIPETTMSGDPGPRVFVFITAAILLVCGTGLVITGSNKGEPFFKEGGSKRLGIIISVVLMWIISMNYLGFLYSTVAVLFVMTTMFDSKKNVPWWGRLLFAVLAAVVIYYLYGTVLQLKLPAGIF